MTATLETLRMQETLTVRGTPVNSDGTSEPVLLTNVTWGGNNAAIATLLQDSGDPYVAYVTGVAPGTTAAHIFTEDAFVVHDDEAAVIVLNASRFKFSQGQILLEPDPLAGDIMGVTVEAFAWDVRDDPLAADIYPYGPGSPPTGIYDVLWTSDTGAVLFGGVPGSSPSGTTTLADTLKAEVFPDLTNGNNEPTTEVVRITAKNSAGATITGSINVTIRRVATVSIEPVEE